jgi:TPR repeat protein
LYRKAADQDYVPAQNRLASMYEGGKGVAKDPAQAVAWYCKAAHADSGAARGSLWRLSTAWAPSSSYKITAECRLDMGPDPSKEALPADQ